ncbi:atrial natriuretic peptide receptor 3-like isoform X3 [Paramacrobiotus metropolitanus]|uniref:atrial natriuretic peptide receptor 3-like isoform X3 n=1 Tax=Paramacrobiotus metropolitanus TaxID=2943436 RepID=UPI0024465838|nr:atrial natriuretic peptide receptor 3-like isoform X3 [Paramacrobiotus metropolitanus]
MLEHMDFFRSASLCLAICWALFDDFPSSAAQSTIALLEYTGRGDIISNPVGLRAVLDEAEDHLRTKYGFQLNVTRKTFNIYRSNPTLCDDLETEMALWAGQLRYNETLDIAGMAIIGPDCLWTSSMNYMAKEWEIPVFVPSMHFANRGNNNRSDYSTLTRVAPFDNEEMVKFVYNVLTMFNCTTCPVVVLCDYDYYRTRESLQGRFITSACRALESGLHKGNKIDTKLFLVNTADTSAVQEILIKASAIAKVIFLVAPGDRVRSIMLAASDQLLTGKEYLYFAVQPWHETEFFGNVTWYSETDPDRNADARAAFDSLFKISTRFENTPEYRNLTSEVKRVSEEKYGYNFSHKDEVLNETLANGGDTSDGPALCRSMWNRTYTVLGNDVVIDAKGDRSVDWILSQMDSTDKFRPIMEYSARSGLLQPRRDPVDNSTTQ